MDDVRQLRDALDRIDGRGYKAYRDIERSWTLGGFVLRVDRAQGDPFAHPSRVRALIDVAQAGLPPSAYSTPSRALGTAALLARDFAQAARGRSRSRGTGRSGEIRMEHPGQVVLTQTALTVSASGAIESRFTVGLPARGRRIDAAQAVALLLDDVPAVVHDTLLSGAHDPDRIELHASTNEDADALRSGLEGAGLVAFVADDALLPRRSGDDDRPLPPESTVPFRAPDSLRVEVEVPNAGHIAGLGIRQGITLIVGGGFHGKSTLLRALQAGVYNHMPGDGRERIVTRSDAVKIRAEDGRSVAGVDISPFIDGLPLGRDTHAFATTNASGSTSQAAAIVEALEAGAGTLLVDEDTSATNFMIRDRRMQELVPKDGEPITPFVDRVRALSDELGVNAVLVLGGSGDYLDEADCVIRMRDYLPDDVSVEARAVAKRLPTGRAHEGSAHVHSPEPRSVNIVSVDARKGRRPTHVKVPDERTMLFGSATIDLAGVEQLESRAQIRAVGLALAWVAGALPEEVVTVPVLLAAIEAAMAEHGLDAFTDGPFGDLAAFRRFELAAALNRLRTLRVA